MSLSPRPATNPPGWFVRICFRNMVPPSHILCGYDCCLRQAPLLLPQEGRDWRQALDVIGQDLESGKEGDRQEGARDSPEQPPDEHPDEHRHGIELEALPVDEG